MLNLGNIQCAATHDSELLDMLFEQDQLIQHINDIENLMNLDEFLCIFEKYKDNDACVVFADSLLGVSTESITISMEGGKGAKERRRQDIEERKDFAIRQYVKQLRKLVDKFEIYYRKFSALRDAPIPQTPLVNKLIIANSDVHNELVSHHTGKAIEFNARRDAKNVLIKDKMYRSVANASRLNYDKENDKYNKRAEKLDEKFQQHRDKNPRLAIWTDEAPKHQLLPKLILNNTGNLRISHIRALLEQARNSNLNERLNNFTSWLKEQDIHEIKHQLLIVRKYTILMACIAGIYRAVTSPAMRRSAKNTAWKEVPKSTKTRYQNKFEKDYGTFKKDVDENIKKRRDRVFDASVAEIHKRTNEIVEKTREGKSK